MKRDDAITRFVVPAPSERLDRVLGTALGVGRRRAKALIDQGSIRLDGRRARASTIAPAGAIVEISPAPAEEHEHSIVPVAPRDTPRIVWSNETLAAIFKPAGFHSVRGAGTPCAADFVATELGDLRALARFDRDCGLVHRLDRDTSGILLAARDERTYDELREAFSTGVVSKEYLALVEGRFDSPQTIDAPLVRLRSRVRPARRSETGRCAVTRVAPLEVGADWSLVAASMQTGVTHQIRAHLALAGFPIVGDAKYGAPSERANAHRLHARRITLPDGSSIAVQPGVEFLETLAALRSGAGEH